MSKKRRWISPERDRVYLIKVGISWPGFFLTGAWLIYKQLWRVLGYGLLFVLLLTLVTIGVVDFLGYDENVREFILTLIAITINIAVAVNGNRWFEESLKRKGYRLVRSKGNVARLTGLNLASDNPTSSNLASTAGTPYLSAWSEISDGQVKPETWLRAFTKSDGDENKTRALYIDYRVNSLTDNQQNALFVTPDSAIQNYYSPEFRSVREHNPSTLKSILIVAGVHIAITLGLPLMLIGLLIVFSPDFREAVRYDVLANEGTIEHVALDQYVGGVEFDIKG